MAEAELGDASHPVDGSTTMLCASSYLKETRERKEMMGERRKGKEGMRKEKGALMELGEER